MPILMDPSGSLGNRCSVHLNYGADTENQAKNSKNQQDAHTLPTPETRCEVVLNAISFVPELNETAGGDL